MVLQDLHSGLEATLVLPQHLGLGQNRLLFRRRDRCDLDLGISQYIGPHLVIGVVIYTISRSVTGFFDFESLILFL